MTKKTFELQHEDELDSVVEEVKSRVENIEREGAVVLALHGDLGAGKTTCMQRLARSYGIKEHVTSPTFVVMKSYPIKGDEQFDQLVHIDAYRIDSVDEMRVLGFNELLAKERTMIGVEWAERIESLLPEERIDLTFSIEGNKRMVELVAP